MSLDHRLNSCAYITTQYFRSKRDDYQNELSGPHDTENLPSPCFQTDSPQKDADNLVSHYIWSTSEPNAQAIDGTNVSMIIRYIKV